MRNSMSNGIKYCASWAVGLPSQDCSRYKTTEEQASPVAGEGQLFKTFKKFQPFKPPPSSSPATRGRTEMGVLNGLNGLNVLN